MASAGLADDCGGACGTLRRRRRNRPSRRDPASGAELGTADLGCLGRRLGELESGRIGVRGWRSGERVGEAGDERLSNGAVALDRGVKAVGAEHAVGVCVELGAEQVGERHCACARFTAATICAAEMERLHRRTTHRSGWGMGRTVPRSGQVPTTTATPSLVQALDRRDEERDRAARWDAVCDVVGADDDEREIGRWRVDEVELALQVAALRSDDGDGAERHRPPHARARPLAAAAPVVCSGCSTPNPAAPESPSTRRWTVDREPSVPPTPPSCRRRQGSTCRRRSTGLRWTRRYGGARAWFARRGARRPRRLRRPGRRRHGRGGRDRAGTAGSAHDQHLPRNRLPGLGASTVTVPPDVLLQELAGHP